LDACIYMNKDVSIHGYFLKPKGAHEQKSLGNTALFHGRRILDIIMASFVRGTASSVYTTHCVGTGLKAVESRAVVSVCCPRTSGAGGPC
jgi:hypothetical protein